VVTAWKKLDLRMTLSFASGGIDFLGPVFLPWVLLKRASVTNKTTAKVLVFR